MLNRYLFILLLLTLAGITGCKPADKKIDWTVTLKKEDKIPYGTWLAYNSLKYYFPGANIQTVSRWFNYNNIETDVKYNFSGSSLLVMTGLSLNISESELQQLLQFANNGNEIVLFGSLIDYKLLKRLNCYKKVSGYEEYSLSDFNDGSKNIATLRLLGNSKDSFGYDGHSVQGYFELGKSDEENDETTDTAKVVTNAEIDIAESPDTLGFVHDKADFIRYRVGEGHITLHAAPLVLCNYFLLQPNNKRYLDGIWKTLPDDINNIYWNEYFKRNAPQSGANVLFRYPATRIAIVLAIITLILYVLFEGKRRQRIVPVVAPVTNSSVSFVETVGRLYYNKRNHTNLADKMINHFLEWVRTNYFLNTNLLNETFIQQLTLKSGQPEEVVRHVATMIHETRLNAAAQNETYLYDLYNIIQLFYNNKK